MTEHQTLFLPPLLPWKFAHWIVKIFRAENNNNNNNNNNSGFH